MSAISSPFGLRPIALIGSQPYAGAIREVPMTVNSAVGIYQGDLVSINAGTAIAAAATPTTTRDTKTPVGVCVGVRFTDPVLHQEQHDTFLPAGAITAGYTNVWIKIADDPDALFAVQADGAVVATLQGMNAQLTNFGAGSNTTGNSGVKLLASSPALTATFAVRIVDFVRDYNNKPGDAYTMCIVKFNQGVHAYQNATGA